MSKPGLILGGAALLAAGLWWTSRETSAPEADPPDVTRHAFLDELDLESGGYALLLHEQVTGDGLRVVRDKGALLAAQDVVFYTDNPGAALKRALSSILFLSPPGMPPSSAFVTVVKDKAVQEVFTCYRAFCQGTENFEPAHEREMAGLLEASEPVELLSETYDHHDKARAAMFKLMQDADVVQIEPPNLPPPNSIVFPARVSLTLPAILLETDESGQAARDPLDEAALEARFRAGFEHVLPETDAYRLGEMQLTAYYPPESGWPIVSDVIDGYLRDEGGEIRGLTGIMLIEARVSVDVTERIATTLERADAFEAMPEFLPPEPPSVAARLDQMAEAHLGRPCPGCFKIELPVTTAEGIHVERRPPPSFPVSYYKVVNR